MQAAFQRYLQILGFDRAPTGLLGLQELVRAHILEVPFENVSKLLLFDREGSGRLNTLEEFLDGIEHHDLGGTCYTSNPFFTELLRQLGYQADLHSADMNVPNVHSCIRVRIDGTSYHVDVGNAAPFLDPIPLNALPYEIQRGEMRWVFDRPEDGRLRSTVFSRGERVHGYTVNEEVWPHTRFRDIILDSFASGRTFMSLLRLVRIFPEHTVELKNRTLRVHRGLNTSETKLNSMDELRAAVDTQFKLPRCPVEKGVEILERLNSNSFFEEHRERSLYA